MPYSLSSRLPSNPALSHLPYQGSIHINGACFFAGDHIPSNGVSNKTDKYPSPSGFSNETFLMPDDSTTKASWSNILSFASRRPSTRGNVLTTFPSTPSAVSSPLSMLPASVCRLIKQPSLLFPGHRNAGCAPSEKYIVPSELLCTFHITFKEFPSKQYPVSNVNLNGYILYVSSVLSSFIQISVSLLSTSANSISLANACCAIPSYQLSLYLYLCPFNFPTKGKSTGDTRFQYAASPLHIYCLPSFLRTRLVSSAPLLLIPASRNSFLII